MSMNNNIDFPAEEAACLAMKPTKSFKVNGVRGIIFLANIVFSAFLSLDMHVLFGVISFFLVYLITTIIFSREGSSCALNDSIAKVPPMLNRWHLG